MAVEIRNQNTNQCNKCHCNSDQNDFANHDCVRELLLKVDSLS